MLNTLITSDDCWQLIPHFKPVGHLNEMDETLGLDSSESVQRGRIAEATMVTCSEELTKRIAGRERRVRSCGSEERE